MQAAPIEPKGFEQSIDHPIYNHPSLEIFFNSIIKTTNPNLVFPYLDYVEFEATNSDYAEIQIKPFTKFVSLETREITFRFSQDHVQSLHSDWGMDASSLISGVIVNEHVQEITSSAFSKAIEYGETNFKELDMPWNPHLDGTVKISRTITFKDNRWQWFLNIFRSKHNKRTITEDVIIDVNNTHTILRKLAIKIRALSNMITMSSRRGPANTIICSGRSATVLQDSAEFMINTSARVQMDNTSSIYYIGSYGGMSVYVNPLMKWNDDRFLLFRKGHRSEPGMHFVYMDEEPEMIESILDGTLVPRMKKRSRESLIEAGLKLHKNFKRNYTDTLLKLSSRELGKVVDYKVGTDEFEKLRDHLMDNFDLGSLQNKVYGMCQETHQPFVKKLVVRIDNIEKMTQLSF